MAHRSLAPRLYRIDEVAKLLAASRSTVARWIEAGALRVVRVPGRGREGSMPRVRAEEVERFLESISAKQA